MKKIMFNDKYCLTQAVLDGTKTMTRRILHGTLFWERCPEGMWTDDEIKAWKKEVDQRLLDYSMTDEWPQMKIFAMKHCRYKVGEVVAIAQSYHTLNKSGYVAPEWLDHVCESSAGYENKMFVRADLMPHHIRITDVKVERLQDISDEDCMREGLKFRYTNMNFGNMLTREDYYYNYLDKYGEINCYGTESPKKTFSIFIDKISGNGTWESNPWVVAYSFELIKSK